MTLEIDGYPQTRMSVPDGVEILRDRTERYTVWRDGDLVFKQQPKYLTDNEFAFLSAMQLSGYVPRKIERHDIETISMEYIETHQVVSAPLFLSHLHPLLTALKLVGIVHGDLTEYAVLVRNDKPIIIDFSESRWIRDPIPSKRREDDFIMLLRTMTALCKKQ